MLRLVNIVKEYKVADTKVKALKGINLSFRKNEFVSILGPSGCGKTTTLNIIGGLDKYTSGDLFINGRSTKEFKDKDWDIYRNHRVGFIFQSYNLIPHQTILSNVELALTIAGLSQNERIEKAKKALDQVGLKDQYNKKPNQLSGGQCQRVAIARALVNEPEILLADEPTGALDTVTSVQIMDLIKTISKEKLVIMVTHNPDLAEKYSTRIIKLLDGEVQSDSNPYSPEEEMKEDKKVVLNEKAKMSWWTSFKLSFKNLLSKKGRSILVSIAGSIGIIGVASVLSVSTGINDYISEMQDDMLSGNPIKVSESAYDLSTIMSFMTNDQKAKITRELAKDKVNVDFIVDQILETVGKTESFNISNNIDNNYLEFVKKMPKEYYADLAFTYGYDLGNNIYTKFNYTKDESTYLSLNAVTSNYESVLSEVEGIGQVSNYITSLVTSCRQLPAHNDYIEKQYDILSPTNAHLPQNKNELLLVLDGDDKLSDLMLAELGYYVQEDFVKLAQNSKDIVDGVNGASHENDKKAFDYEEILNHEFYYVPTYMQYIPAGSFDYKISNDKTISLPKFTYLHELENLDDSNIQKLKISAIVKPKKGIRYGSLKTGLYYTEGLSKQLYNDATIDKNRATFNNYTFTSILSVYPQIPNSPQSPFASYEYKYYDYTSGTKVEKTAVQYLGDSNEVLSLLATQMPGIVNTKTLTARKFGLEENPNNINIFPKNFNQKNEVTDYLDQWNNEDYKFTLESGLELLYKDRTKVTYTDNVGVIIGMVRTLINIVTSALIAFTALSLVVSCFMIAIITYVSVMERVKEIGVIRSLGGRKKDVSHLFNAETFMLGLSSGIIGVVITYIITFILNIALVQFTGANIAAFYWYQALLMILLSVVLTVLSGAIPARSAAKQDPVNALRSE